MALGVKLANFVELGFEMWGEEIEYISKELEEAGNDPENLEKDLLLMLKKAKAEVKVEKGKKLNEAFHDFIKTFKELPYDFFTDKPQLALAYRKLNDTSYVKPEEILDEDDKLMIIEYLKSMM